MWTWLKRFYIERQSGKFHPIWIVFVVAVTLILASIVWIPAEVVPKIEPAMHTNPPRIQPSVTPIFPHAPKRILVSLSPESPLA